MNNLTPELIAKAKATKSAQELLELAKANNIELTEEEAKTLAGKMLDEKIASLTMESGAEVTKLYTETINDGLEVTAIGYVSVVMRIDEQREVHINHEEVME